jgi:hypothetical protein
MAVKNLTREKPFLNWVNNSYSYWQNYTKLHSWLDNMCPHVVLEFFEN